jgi:signal transduction histidine kinase
MISSVEEGLLLAGIVLALAVLEYQRRRGRKLRRRISSLRHQLEKMREELFGLQRDRLNLLASVTSAMEEPLEEILEEAEELSRPGERDPGEVQRGLSRLRQAADAISRQRDTLVEIDHLRTTALDPDDEGEDAQREGWDRELALDDLLSEAIQRSSESLGGKRLNLTVAMDEGVMVRGSRNYLARALSALLARTMGLAPVDSILSVTLERKPPSAELRIAYRGSPRTRADRLELSEELARQVMISHRGWLRQGKKPGEYQAGLPLA